MTTPTPAPAPAPAAAQPAASTSAQAAATAAALWRAVCALAGRIDVRVRPDDPEGVIAIATGCGLAGGDIKTLRTYAKA